MPKRIQMSRKKGWRKPEGAVYVGRPTKWGNPFLVSNAVATGKYRAGCTVAGHLIGVPTVEDAVECYRLYLNDKPELVTNAREELAGKDLGCWCKMGDPCHADVLLEIANAPDMERDR